MNTLSQKHTSVRNKPWYIRLTAYLMNTGYIKCCVPNILNWRIFGRPSLTRSTQSDKGHIHIMHELRNGICLPIQNHSLTPRIPNSECGYISHVSNRQLEREQNSNTSHFFNQLYIQHLMCRIFAPTSYIHGLW